MITQRTLWRYWKRLSALITALMLIIVLPGIDLEAYRSVLPEPSACTWGVYEVGAFHTSTNYDAGVSGMARPGESCSTTSAPTTGGAIGRRLRPPSIPIRPSTSVR